MQIWEKAPKDSEMEGLILECLKESFVAKKRLTQECSEQVKSVMEQQVLHYDQDPVLMKTCNNDVHKDKHNNISLLIQLL